VQQSQQLRRRRQGSYARRGA